MEVARCEFTLQLMPKQCCNHCAAPAGHPFRGAGFAGLRKVTGFGVFDAGFTCVCVFCIRLPRNIGMSWFLSVLLVSPALKSFNCLLRVLCVCLVNLNSSLSSLPCVNRLLCLFQCVRPVGAVSCGTDACRCICRGVKDFCGTYP